MQVLDPEELARQVAETGTIPPHLALTPAKPKVVPAMGRPSPILDPVALARQVAETGQIPPERALPARPSPRAVEEPSFAYRVRQRLGDDVYNAVDDVFRKAGISTFAWAHNAHRESGGNPNASDPTGRAIGLFQFDKSGVLGDLTRKYGREKALQIARDPVAAARIMAAEAVRQGVNRESDPARQALLFTEKVERPARKYVEQVRRELARYPTAEAAARGQQIGPQAPKPVPQERVSGPGVWDVALGRPIRPRTGAEKVGRGLQQFATQDTFQTENDTNVLFRQAQAEGRAPLSPTVRSRLEEKELQVASEQVRGYLNRQLARRTEEAQGAGMVGAPSGYGAAGAREQQKALARRQAIGKEYLRAISPEQIVAGMEAEGVRLNPKQQELARAMAGFALHETQRGPQSAQAFGLDLASLGLSLFTGAVVESAAVKAGAKTGEYVLGKLPETARQVVTSPAGQAVTRILSPSRALGGAAGNATAQAVSDLDETLTPQERARRIAHAAGQGGALGPIAGVAGEAGRLAKKLLLPATEQVAKALPPVMDTPLVAPTVTAEAPPVASAVSARPKTKITVAKRPSPEPVAAAPEAPRVADAPPIETPLSPAPKRTAVKIQAKKPAEPVLTNTVVPPGKATGLANQVQEREALEGILKNPASVNGESSRVLQQKGEALVKQHGPGLPDRVAQEIADGRGVNPEDMGVLLAGKVAKLNDIRSQQAALDEAIAAGSPNVPRLREKLEAAQHDLQDYLDKVQIGKGKWSDIGRALQAGTDLDTGDFADVIARARRAKGGSLTPAEEKRLRGLADDIAKMRTQTTVLEEEVKKAQAGRVTAAEAKRAARAMTREKILADRAAIHSEIDEILKSATKVQSVTGLPYEAARFAGAAGRLALTYAREGLVNLDEVVEKVISDFKARGVDITPAQVAEEINTQSKGKPQTKTELQQRLGTVKQQARRFESLTAEIEALKKGEAKAHPQRKPQLSKRIADLEGERDDLLAQMGVKKELERVKSGKPRQVTTRPKPAPSPELAKLQAELAAARKAGKTGAEINRLQQQVDTLKKGGTLPKAAAGAPPDPRVAALQGEKADLLAQGRLRDKLAGKTVTTVKKPGRTPSPELQKLQDEYRAALKEGRTQASLTRMKDQIDALRRGEEWKRRPKVERSEEMKAAFKERQDLINQQDVRKRIADLEEQLRTGKYTEKTKREVAISDELENLRAREALLSSEVRNRIEAAKPKTPLQRAANAGGALKSLVSSIDLSAPGRQGLLLGAGNADKVPRAFAAQMQALSSEVAAQKLQTAILERPNAALYRKSKLYLSPVEGAGLSQGEEAFSGLAFRNWKKLNPYAASERAYSAYLNSLRADVFDRMVEQAGRTDEKTLTAIAHYVNGASGRGGGGNKSFEQAAQYLGGIMFSPRYVASRFEYVAGTSLYGGTGASRKAIARQYAQTLGALGAFLVAAKAGGAKIETDPASSDYLKIRIGDTRIDTLAGLQQGVVASYRVLSGRYKTTTGRTIDMRHKTRSTDPDAWDVGTRFVRSKLAPLPGIAVNLAQGEDYLGNPYGLRDVPKELAPLSVKELVTGLQEDGWSEADAYGLLNFLGVPVSTYTPGQRKRERPN